MRVSLIQAALTVLAILIQTPAADAQSPNACNNWLKESQVQSLLAAFDTIAEAEPVWSNFSIAHHPVALAGTAAEAGGCALIWRHGEPPEVLPLDDPAPVPAQLYGFWNGEDLGPDAQPDWSMLSAPMARTAPEIEAALTSRGESRVMVLLAPLRYGEMGPLGEALTRMGMDPVVLLGRLAIHESYHLHAQFPTWFDQGTRYLWPDWLAMSDRNQLVQTCYQGTPEVAAARTTEMDLLLATWDHLYSEESRNAEAARAEARRYIDARNARYALLDTATVATMDGGMTCKDAEAVWELTEGSAQWVGSRSSVQAGLSDLSSVRARFRGGPNPSFYTSGSFQLWVLDSLLGRDSLLDVTTGITRSTDPEGSIFDAFTHQICSPNGR